MLSRLLLVAIAWAFAAGVQAVAPETPEEFIQVFQSGGQLEQEKAAQALEWAGLSSPQVFDLVEAAALKSLPQATNKVNINYVAYLTKGLAYSGNEKYRASIQKIIDEAPNNKLKKYGQQALSILTAHAKDNPIIAPQVWPEHPHPALDQRLANMLKSDDTELVRLAAKRMHYALHYPPELLAQLNTTIEQNYQKPLEGERLDAIAWACRALAGSRTPEYKATIVKVSTNANTRKLRSYAKKYLGYYGD